MADLPAPSRIPIFQGQNGKYRSSYVDIICTSVSPAHNLGRKCRDRSSNDNAYATIPDAVATTGIAQASAG